VGLLAPVGLALFGLAVPLVLLYLLKQKRQDRVVPSTMLWAKVLSDIQARHPFQRLRANLLLLLQLLVLALLALAVARPVVRSSAREAKAVAVVLDATASMTARGPGGRPRFEEARAAARELVKNLAPQDRAMVVVAGRAARTAKALTDAKEELLRAIDAARPEEARGETRDAVLLAASALKPFGAAGEVHVFGDGGGGELPSAGETGVAVRFHAAGAPGENVGVTGLDLVRGKDGRVEVFATVENSGAGAARRFATLVSGGKPVATRELRLAARSEEPVVFREALAPGKLEVRLDGSDALACDDAAYAVLLPPEPLAVGIVGRSHAALERALRMAGDVVLYAAAPDAASFKDDPRYRLVIYDGYDGPPPAGAGAAAPLGPTRAAEPLGPALPDRPTVVFGPRRSLPGVRVLAEVDGPEITGVERDHPLFRFVEPSGIAIARARPLSLDGPGRAILRSDRGVLAVESRARRDPLVVIGMDLRESSFAAEEAFPVFVLNILHMARRQGGSLAPERIQAGEPLGVRVSAEGGEGEAALVRPSGERVVRRARGGRADFLETTEVGFYEVSADGKTATVAASLLDRDETRIEPRAPVDSAGAVLATEAPIVAANREVWRWLALAALLALVVEAWAYHRRL
jgi:hypothetical protein